MHHPLSRGACRARVLGVSPARVVRAQWHPEVGEPGATRRHWECESSRLWAAGHLCHGWGRIWGGREAGPGREKIHEARPGRESAAVAYSTLDLGGPKGYELCGQAITIVHVQGYDPVPALLQRRFRAIHQAILVAITCKVDDPTARQAPSFSAGKDSVGWGGGACPRRGQTHLSMT